jgi:hypothetical protein
MPKVYQSPASPVQDPTLTHFQVFVGPQAPFHKDRPTHYPRDFTDGTSNTILIVEAAKPVPWTAPEDLAFDPNQPLPELGIGPTYINVGLADGSTRALAKRTLSQQTLRATITPNGNEVLGPDW